jgi:hypothetical protein
MTTPGVSPDPSAPSYLLPPSLLQHMEWEWVRMAANDRLGEGMRDVFRKAIIVQRWRRNLVKLRAVYRTLKKYKVMQWLLH